MKCFLLLALFSLSAGLPLQGLRGNDFELFNNLTKKLRRPSDLIFGGDHAKQGQWPWQAFLIMTNFEGGTYICGGSLISKKHVLTAAHCTDTLDLRSPSIVMFGVVDVESAWNTPGAQLKKIRSFVEKDGYDGNSSALYDDIAIITLDSEVKITKDVQIVKIKKDDEKIVATPKDTVSGFGTYMFKDGVPVTSDSPLRRSGPYRPRVVCKALGSRHSQPRPSLEQADLCRI
ncbi:hypothetical protein L596_030472 [Steinernema carpocapsae]|uniref:Peptidase S1 domain-containing protein n=1 Tax=Steinernema carpocapsae TaxID=34508 RepID=A0A4U5LPJ6_STECR|nr:hypothetical protein L596_030472 [Steinernema carpocapsae]